MHSASTTEQLSLVRFFDVNPATKLWPNFLIS